MPSVIPGLAISDDDLQAALDANTRILAALKKTGNASISVGGSDGSRPLQTYRMDMRSPTGVGSSANNPFKIGPHKCIFFRNIVVGSPGAETPQTFNTTNDVAYYIPLGKDADPSMWMALQVGKSIEFDEPVREGYVYMPNALGNPTFAIFETSVVAYIRSYATQAANLGSVSLTSGTSVTPGAATTITSTSSQLVIGQTTTKVVTIQHQGGNDVWFGGVNSGLTQAVANAGIKLSVGQNIVFNTTSDISAVTASGTASLTYQIES